MPDYPEKHSGPVLVCGNAWTLHDDYASAVEIFGSVPVIAVNGAAGQVKAFALFTQHPRKFPRWIKMQRDRFGDDFTTHAAGNREWATKLGKPLKHEYVDYWWPDATGGGTSAWGARRMAGMMGFDTVILCGVPLEPGGYADNEPTQLMRNVKLMRHYQDQIKKDTKWHTGVYGMSGWTRDFFGDGSRSQ